MITIVGAEKSTTIITINIIVRKRDMNLRPDITIVLVTIQRASHESRHATGLKAISPPM